MSNSPTGHAKVLAVLKELGSDSVPVPTWRVVAAVPQPAEMDYISFRNRVNSGLSYLILTGRAVRVRHEGKNSYFTGELTTHVD